jgi:origin recognition complex subunit 2
LVQRFAVWLQEQQPEAPIVVVNGYVPTVTLRSVFASIIEAALGEDAPDKLGTQPAEVLETLQSILSGNPPPKPITVLINSIDALTVRRPSHQSLLARLAKLPYINMLATADIPNFLLLWDVTLRDEFNFVFHDCTTFAPFAVELDVVTEVHQLFGRKTSRIGGRQGVGFVLKSLPENTRKLYRLLITEILTLLGDQNLSGDEDNNADPNQPERGNKIQDAAIEWRTLFNKASEEFISSSEMMFRTQLKEFYDHQMIVSTTDASGAEMLGVPLSREEMEGVLEELVFAN